MRQVVLDTETTGLNKVEHRIVEVGCVELVNRRYTGRTLHHYLNPERSVEAGAKAVHGLDETDLADKPRFAEIADELREFIAGATLIIHNAPFDVDFLDAEYARLDPAHGSVSDWAEVLDTLALARAHHPGQTNNLDALCKRHGVDNRGRELHGALLDAQLLTEVWLAMTGGQVALGLDRERSEAEIERAATAGSGAHAPLPAVVVSAAERAAHAARLVTIRERAGFCLWDKIGAKSAR